MRYGLDFFRFTVVADEDDALARDVGAGTKLDMDADDVGREGGRGIDAAVGVMFDVRRCPLVFVYPSSEERASVSLSASLSLSSTGVNTAIAADVDDRFLDPVPVLFVPFPFWGSGFRIFLKGSRWFSSTPHFMK